MRKRIIAGNWKMYKSAEEATSFVKELQQHVPASERLETVICAPFLYLQELVQRTEQTSIRIGAQNMHEAHEGAFTGEISPTMLSSVGVQYVIIGHSERRQYFNETDAAVNRKAHAAFEAGLTPIICVGESLAQREAGQTVAWVEDQVEKALAQLTGEQVQQAIIAYEPIWAIGTGKTATADDANEVCGAIRAKMAALYSPEVANQVVIQYGGSVKPETIEELLAMEHVDGALVGGASLEVDSFRQLLEVGARG